MKGSFVDRMAVQRRVLQVINDGFAADEKLFGLSFHAIDRWALINRIDRSSELIRLIRKIASELFFIATKSQEPVSEEHILRWQEIADCVVALENALHN